VLDNDVSLEGFHLPERSGSAVRADYGGVELYVRSTLVNGVSLVRKDNNFAGCELLWVRIQLAAGSSLLLGACYLAPETSRVYPARVQRMHSVWW
jgi:hypothetical protein